MKFNIDKILIIETPIQFYKLLVNNSFISNEVVEFLGSWKKWQTSQVSESDKKWQNVLKSFRDLKNKDLSKLVERIGCDSIQFSI